MRVLPPALMCLALVACGDFDSRSGDGDTLDGALMGVDAGTDANTGSTRDGGAPGDAGSGEDSDYVLARDGMAAAPVSVGGLDACYSDDACGSSMCEGVRSCCVGSGACCAATGADPAPSLLVSATCSDYDPAEDCLGPGMSGFGSPLPYVFAGGLVPGGDELGDSGLLADDPIDLTVHHAVLTATIRTAAACGAACIETLGLGLTEQSSVTESVHPIAALVYSRSRNRVTLMVGEAQLAAWSDISDGEQWSLELLPSGTVDVQRDGSLPNPEFVPVPYQPSTSARLTIYGHTVNPSAMAPSRLEDVTFDVSLCDVPDAWANRQEVPVTLSAGGQLLSVRAPSLLRGTRTLLVWEQAGEIWLAEDLGSGFVAQDGPLLVADMDKAWMNEAVGDPDIVERPDGGGYAVFFTGHESSGRPTIGRLDLDASLEPSPVNPVTQIATGADVDGDEISQPTVWQHSADTWILVARARENETTHLRVLRSDDAGQNWSRHLSTALDTLTARTETRSTSGFDSDDLGHPSLVVYNGAWQLYYTGQRGTRSGVGLLLSDDLVNWRAFDPSKAILRPGASADEQVGVLGEDVVVESFGLSMVYVADDGYQQRLYSTSRRATDTGTF